MKRRGDVFPDTSLWNVFCSTTCNEDIQRRGFKMASHDCKQFFLFIFLIFSLTTAFFAPILNARGLEFYSEPLPEDNFAIFLDSLVSMNNIHQLDDQGLAQGHSSFEPWAGSYWPIHQGLLANRYADHESPSKQFIENYMSFQRRPANMLIASGNINQLSPAEKYDLLVGDRNWSLTNFMWQKGLTGYQTDGFVATWTGICHGWSAATSMGIKQSEKSVTVKDVTGNYQITFFPQDIKGLQSYLWGNSAPVAIQAGNRCRQSYVGRDPFLRPLDPSCLDSNPMTWHLAATNRIGIYQNSFVMDSSSGTEVWNYPVMSYDYSYFNPRTFESSHSLNASIEPIEMLKADKYSATRSPKAKYIVGVAMDVFHPALVVPRVGVSTGNVLQYNVFIYDLELDENFTIIGGEWYSKDRPDFLWSFPKGSLASTREDSEITAGWDISTNLPSEIAGFAQSASARGKVLSTIANALNAASLGSAVIEEPAAPDDPIDSGTPPEVPTVPPVVPPVIPPIEPPLVAL